MAPSPAPAPEGPRLLPPCRGSGCAPRPSGPTLWAADVFGAALCAAGRCRRWLLPACVPGGVALPRLRAPGAPASRRVGGMALPGLGRPCGWGGPGAVLASAPRRSPVLPSAPRRSPQLLARGTRELCPHPPLLALAPGIPSFRCTSPVAFRAEATVLSAPSGGQRPHRRQPGVPARAHIAGAPLSTRAGVASVETPQVWGCWPAALSPPPASPHLLLLPPPAFSSLLPKPPLGKPLRGAPRHPPWPHASQPVDVSPAPPAPRPWLPAPRCRRYPLPTRACQVPLAPRSRGWVTVPRPHPAASLPFAVPRGACASGPLWLQGAAAGVPPRAVREEHGAGFR